MIYPSKLEVCLPLLFAKKKDGRIRICIDYCQINECLRKDVYCLPKIDELIDYIKGNIYYTRPDFQGAYHQLRMHPSSEWLTTFSRKYGNYTFRVMPFGLLVAPAHFQLFINHILLLHFRENVLVYLDDIFFRLNQRQSVTE
jgi:Reverse transcriptase (RNA-dependent DNA polymerase)